MARLTVVTIIQAPVERCFDLARDVDVHWQTAAFTRERTVKPGRTSGLLVAGDLVTFEGVHLGLRWRLTARIVEMDRPHRFVDEQVRGPFRQLRHVHTFEQAGEKTEMTDVIEFQSPFGPLGWIADQLFVGPHLKRFVVRKQAGLKTVAESERGEITDGASDQFSEKMNQQEPWSYERFVEHYNRLADDGGGWYYDGSVSEEELQRRYEWSPTTYPTISDFAYGLFIWDQRVNI